MATFTFQIQQEPSAVGLDIKLILYRHENNLHQNKSALNHNALKQNKKLGVIIASGLTRVNNQYY